jgi:hypothetical protein
VGEYDDLYKDVIKEDVVANEEVIYFFKESSDIARHKRLLNSVCFHVIYFKIETYCYHGLCNIELLPMLFISFSINKLSIIYHLVR